MGEVGYEWRVAGWDGAALPASVRAAAERTALMAGEATILRHRGRMAGLFERAFVVRDSEAAQRLYEAHPGRYTVYALVYDAPLVAGA